ncbi:MAG: hypothetical protein E7262_08530 [Lachnospiraceae bacterium]|nr:hypothetical protein [Lachnospiraceae bacterium]
MNNNFTMTNDYILFLLPVDARTIKEIINEKLDMLEYQDSYIYHEYPDKNELLRTLEEIYSSPIFPTSHASLRDLAHTMLVYEILDRRNRYFNIISNFEE